MGLTTQARFGGVWQARREIVDFGGGPAGRFQGLARITDEGEAMRYAEQGRLVLGVASMTAARTYLWRPEGETGVSVFFEDGAPFHRFDWSRAECESEHLCGEDRYVVRYSFAAESWHAHWRVAGPRKDYASTTRYIRA